MKSEAQHIGQKLALKCSAVGLSIAYILMIYFFWDGAEPLDSIFWLRDNLTVNVLVGATGVFMAAYFIGRSAGVSILLRRRNASLIGIMTGLAVLWCGTIMGSTVGFIQEGVQDIGTNDDPFLDYYFKPFFWINFFGLLPAIFIGMWFGNRIKRTAMNK